MSESSNDSGDRVVFKNVPGVFKLGENVTVRFELDPSFKWHARDWVGLFRVGWTSNRDYYTFEWVSAKAADQTSMTVTFSSSRLPHDDGNFYQFSYVSRSGVARGASRPFQFSRTVSEVNSEELELVEVEEDQTLLLLQSRKDAELAELQKKVVELQSKSESVEASYSEAKASRSALEADNGRLRNELSAALSEMAVVTSAVEAKEEEIQQLKRQLQGSHEQVAELSKENTALKNEAQALEAKLLSQEKERELQVNQLRQELDVQEKAVHEVGQKMNGVLAEMDKLQHEKAESETQLRFHCSDLEGRIVSLEQEKESLVIRAESLKDENSKLQQVVEVQNAQIVSLEADVNTMAEQLGREKVITEELQGQLEAREQECNIASENLCEMMGNITEPRDQLPAEDPVDKVEMSVVNALQLAFSDLEKRLNGEKKRSAQLTNKNAELEERIKKCKEEFMQVSNQNVKLQHHIKKMGGTVSGISTPEEPTRYKEEVAALQKELDEFHARHDERIAEKNDALDQLKQALEEKDDALTQLQQALEEKDQEVTRLRTQVQTLQTEVTQVTTENRSLKQRLHQPCLPLQTQHQYPSAAQPVYPVLYTPPPQGGYLPQHSHPMPPPGSNAGDSNTRVCPVCNTHFPKRMANDDIQKHVNGHFRD